MVWTDGAVGVRITHLSATADVVLKAIRKKEGKQHRKQSKTGPHPGLTTGPLNLGMDLMVQ